ncbi:alpha/beta fold hydrolase [Aliidiomarina sanyensis]|uniref:Alpha/beta hydrolase n=1 Tax=Aliidiomarina sanyensis TaxID=1249555 RepID=A0A432WKC5_9GAMM|nr:alpha/beta hydrolase [Aliidiomarina sanyensis]RUO34215.1 alpha/beta hydrolase [Aliidiomarina sanyensis]
MQWVTRVYDQKTTVQHGEIPWIPYVIETKAGFKLRGLRTQSHAGSSRPVLHFIHGNSYSGLTYLPLLMALHPHADLVLHDAQGHGDSDHGGPFIGWNNSALIVREAWYHLRAHYPGQQPVGVGHSFGGVLTSLAASQDPQLFDRLLLLDPIVFSPRMIQVLSPLRWFGVYKLNPIARKARRRRMEWPSLAAVIESLQGRGMFRGWTDAALLAYAEHATEPMRGGGRRLKCAPEREAEIFSSYAEGLWPALQTLETPTQVWVGEHTYPFVHTSMNYWQRNPAVRGVAVVPGGHCFMQEHPVMTAEQLIQEIGAP